MVRAEQEQRPCCESAQLADPPAIGGEASPEDIGAAPSRGAEKKSRQMELNSGSAVLVSVFSI